MNQHTSERDRDNIRRNAVQRAILLVHLWELAQHDEEVFTAFDALLREMGEESGG